MRLISWNVNGRYGPALPRQSAAVLGRDPDLVALQEVRAESLPTWCEALDSAGFDVLDSSDLLSAPTISGRECGRRIYFNLIAARAPLRRLDGLELEFPERYLAASAGEIEVHTAHLPPGSTRGLVKVEMFEALYARLANATSKCPRILCGDFNAPRDEHADGTVEFWGSEHRPHTQRWDDGERSVVLGLAEHDLPDVFRAINGYGARDVSWVVRRGEKQWGRRYDHILASERLGATACRYLHDWREQGLSDHSAIEADFAAPPGESGG